MKTTSFKIIRVACVATALFLTATSVLAQVPDVVTGEAQFVGSKHPTRFQLRAIKMGVPEFTELRPVPTHLIQQITKVKAQTPGRFGLPYIVPGHSPARL